MKTTQNSYLINELPTMKVVADQDLSPKLWLTTLDKITGLLFEHGVLVCDCDELIVTETFSVSNVCKVRVPGLAEFSDDERLIELSRA
jgi:hypothetical protein